MNRRALIILLGTSVTTILLPLLPFKSLAERPRYRHRKGRTLVFPRQSQVLYLNRKSGIIRYGRWEHTDPSVRQLKIANYEALTFDEVIQRLKAQKEADKKAEEEGSPRTAKPRLSLPGIERILERIMLESIRRRRYDDARRFLWTNLAGENSDLLLSNLRYEVEGRLYDFLEERLYDLLAALTVRFGTEEDYNHFIAVVSSREVPHRDEAKWYERVAKWKNKNSKWYSKWKSKEKERSWAGLLM
jgi:hypothetical protein